MSDFTTRNWNEALASLYERALSDENYRQLCLSDPAAALREVSDIDLPPTLKFRFIDSREDHVYTYILPPRQRADVTREDAVREVIHWSTVCTLPTCEDVPR